MNVPGAKPLLKMLRSSHWYPDREGAQRNVVCTAFGAVPRHCDTMMPGPIAGPGAGGGGGFGPGVGDGVGAGVPMTVAVGVRVAAEAGANWLRERRNIAGVKAMATIPATKGFNEAVSFPPPP